MSGETRKQKKRPYRPPCVRSEKILVANLFASEGQTCIPECPPIDE